MAYITSANDPWSSVEPPAETPPAESAHGEYAIRPLSARVLRLTISGFWTSPIVAEFARALNAAVTALPCAPGEHRLLCDISDAAIQSQPIYEAFFVMLAENRRPARRVALLSVRPISRMQARRLMTARSGIAMFDDEPAALRWLMADP